MPILDPIEPHPAPEHIRHAGHHWLQQRSIDGNTHEEVVLQWSPTMKKWFQSGMLASIAKPIDTTYWKYLAPCPLPPV